MKIRLGSLGLPELAAVLERHLRRVPLSDFVPVTSPASADAPFIVRHTLGVKPFFFTWMAKSDLRCYATAEDMLEWNERQVKIRCTAADASLVIELKA